MRELKQIKAGGDKPYEKLEPAYRFGFGAHLRFGNRDWDANFEMHLAEDWRAVTPTRKQKWEYDRNAILDGWNFGEKVSKKCDKEDTLQQNIEQNDFSAHRNAIRMAA